MSSGGGLVLAVMNIWILPLREIDCEDGRWMELAPGSCSVEVHRFFPNNSATGFCPEPVKSYPKSIVKYW
jgi:hypothetical protein